MMRARMMLASLALLAARFPDCGGGGADEDFSQTRTIKIQIEGCKEQTPTPAPIALVTSAAVTSSGIAALATPDSTQSGATPAQVALAAVSATPPAAGYAHEVGELKALLDSNRLSRVDLPAVDSAMTRADEEAAAGHFDEALRQIGVAQSWVRLSKITIGLLNTKMQRLSADVESIRTTDVAEYNELQKEIRDGQAAVLGGQYNDARDTFWKVENRLSYVRAKPRGARR